MKLYERLPDSIVISGKSYKLDLDFRNVLKMLYVLERAEIVPLARDWLALKCVMKKPPKDYITALAEVKTFLFGESKADDGKRVTSFEQDADLIRAAFMQEYGINLFREKLHWFEFTAFLYNLPNGNKYTEVVGIRGKPIPPATKWNQQEREALIKAKAAYALNYTEDERKKSYNDSLNRVFADMKKIADRK